MSNEPSALSPRGLGALLDEAFAIYGRHLRRWLVIGAVVYLPVGLVEIGLGQISGGSAVAFITYVMGMAGAVLVYGAIVYGVAQHYVTGVVEVRECYARAWWRVRSLTLLALAPAVALLGMALPLRYAGDVAGTTLALLLAPLTVAAAVYWSMAVPAVVVERERALGSLKRSFVLVSGSWWRVFGVAVTLMLVALGLAIVVTIPVGLIATAVLSGSSLASGTVAILVGAGDLLVGVVVPPVLLIAWTLLYDDLRVRKEEYDVAAMSRELGIAAT